MLKATSAGNRKERSAAPPRQGLLLSAFTILLVAAMLGPLMTMSDLPGLGSESPIRQVIYILVLLMTLVALRPTEDIRRLMPLPIPLLLALGWCWLSLSWAISKPVSFSHLVLSTIVIWSIYSCIRYLGYQKAMLLLRTVMAIFVVVNFAAIFATPDFAIHQWNDPDDKTLTGDWRGIMMHKNVLGAFAATTILAFAFDCARFPNIVRLLIAALAGLLLVNSGSKTSFGMLIGALAIGYIFLQYNVRYRPLALALIGLITVGVVLVAYIYSDPLTMSFTDPTAFTGRPVIWKAVTDYWLDHPFTGSGFGSFWGIGAESPIYHYGTGWVTTVFTSHNGFLQLLAEVGLPGLLLILFATAIWPVGQLLGAKAIEGPRSAVLISFLFFAIGHNATESSLFDRDQLVNVIILIAGALISWGRFNRASDSFSFDISRKML